MNADGEKTFNEIVEKIDAFEKFDFKDSGEEILRIMLGANLIVLIKK